MKTLADRIIGFNTSLNFKGNLPNGIHIMNPFKESPAALTASTEFYKKYYSDNHPRHLILGINPGRFGSGQTGVPFTDPKRLKSACGINFEGPVTHEPSSVFIYDMIAAYGGPERFYHDIYISSVSPLGFTNVNNLGKHVNYNYYDSAELTKAVYPFMIESLNRQLQMGIETDLCFCFGTGQNEKFIRKLNQEHGFFKEIISLEHPRFIMQYKSKNKQFYIDKYLEAFGRIT
ncbi:DUF4918 domain-containing protein [Mucilaginibacter sp. PPCGB 2223]|uniref:uracil-DNA glycosylase family protein n=1 Tax=Mucilaginibacter sp. PPCGB 2223 TaxID=1886027 RepID=UPI0008261181|nr:uracil-DNA glycosylase family protein [Mucilaginibacter sp. PPCGB 2223]OCX50971.1 DUF4918 domain-containing protein [Mucilaginibacter sp. PPCGB 2223]